MEFIVVGGVAAVLQGVPMTTIDLDVVHRRTEENVARLVSALDELDARSRLDQRQLRPKPSHLMSAGHQLLTTNAGLRDILDELAGEYRFEDLFDGAERVQVEGRTVLLLPLAKLIETKSKAGRAKDLAAVPLIRHTLEVKQRGS